MNVVDVLLLAVSAFALYDGVRRGFIVLGFSLVVWGLAFAIAIALSRVLFTAYANVGLEVGGLVRILIFSFVLFLAAAWMVVAGRRLAARTRAFLERHHTIGFAERWLGVFPALARTGITAAVLLTGVTVFPFWPPAREAVTDSVIASYLVDLAAAAEAPLAYALGAADRPLFLSVIHDSQEQPLLFAEGADASVDFAAEDALFGLLNEERSRNGLPSLTRDIRLTVVARDHAWEMFELHELSHYSPRTGSPSDRLDRHGIGYSVMGENVAYAPNATLAHQGFLRSPSHKRNLLDPRFQSVGVGAVTLGVSGTLYVQVFAAR